MQYSSAALYMRLSRDDGSKTESDSIASQRLFLFDYCKKNGFEISDVYIDDGYSGTNFDRPEFKRMISDAVSGKFCTVITKDMSRLGRDYIVTGEYIERFFPVNGIRYIAVNDGIDTESGGFGNDMIPFRAVFNDMYAKDISRKVRTALDSRRAAGKFIGSSAPYGYVKDENDKSRLLPDMRCANVVIRIYSEFASGKSMLSIAEGLSKDEVTTPSEMKNDNRRKSVKWNSVMIKRILTNPTYRGNLTQGFCTKINYKTQKRRRCLPERRFIVYGTHEPLVDEILAEAVDKRLENSCRSAPD